MSAPATITVTFAGAGEVQIPLDRVTGGVAHYLTTDPVLLGDTVVSATADVPEGWKGQFNLSHGPCGPSPSPTPSVSISS